MGKRNSLENSFFFLNSLFLKIVMEYCGAGSVSDILKLRGKTVNKKKHIEFILYFFDLVKRTRNSCYIKIYT